MRVALLLLLVLVFLLVARLTIFGLLTAGLAMLTLGWTGAPKTRVSLVGAESRRALLAELEVFLRLLLGPDVLSASAALTAAARFLGCSMVMGDSGAAGALGAGASAMA